MKTKRERRLKTIKMILPGMVIAAAIGWLLLGGVGSRGVRAQAGGGCAVPNFAFAGNFAVGDQPRSVAVGDFNSDGKPDLVAANLASNNVSLLIGNGAGGFSAATNFAVSGGPIAVAVGDFNADGKLDLATANVNSNNVSLLLGNGTGGFSAPSYFAVADGPKSIVIADFNADGKPDLATSNYNFNVGQAVSVLLNNGAGGFSPATNFAARDGGAPEDLAVGDFNSDGKPDLAVVNNFTDNVSLLIGNGAGGFSPATNFGVANSPLSVAVGDFNSDGKNDIVTVSGCCPFFNGSILIGNGAGGFSPATNFRAGNSPNSVEVGDFNVDGKPDLAVAAADSFDSDPDNVSVLIGDGAGGFSAPTEYGIGGGDGPQSLAVGDFNADGKPDIGTANTSSDNLSVLRNNCPPLTLSPSTLPDGTVAAPYSQTVSAGDATGPYTYAVTGGALPPGLLLNSSTGQISGTPTQAGVFNFSITATDAPSGRTGTRGYTLRINCPTITVRPPALPDAAQGVSYSQTFTASGGTAPYAFTLGGQLPPGLSLNSSTGQFSGTPTAPGSYDFTVSATDFYGCVGSTSYRFIVELPPGSGGCGAPSFTRSNIGLSAGALFVVAGDLNLDGKPDLVAGISGNNVSVLLGNGAGGFSAPTNFFAGGGTFSGAIGDFNSDGKPDLAVANQFTDQVAILLGDGAGNFSAPAYYGAGDGPQSVAVGDFNSDGKPDLALTNQYTFAPNRNGVSILLNNGAGGFSGPTFYNLGSRLPEGVAVGDFNGDQKLDLAIANGGALDSVGVLLGNGDGTLLRAGLHPRFRQPVLRRGRRFQWGQQA